jgi:hypothetical protein
LQTKYFSPEGGAEGDLVRITRVDSTGTTFSIETIGRTSGQNREWPVSLADAKFSFDAFSPLGASLSITFPNGNGVLLTESATMIR